jgi:tetratricopeptide (TPR) repeat protein
VRRRQGRFPEAVASYRRSADLNPRYHLAWFNYGETALFLRRYDQAGPALAKVTELAPDFLEGYVQRARLAISSRGDLDAARKMLRSAEERIPPTAWRASMLDFARVIYGSNLQQYLGRLRPGAYGLDSGTYHLVKGRFLTQMGRPEATAEYDSARIVLEAMLETQPALAWIRAQLAMAYAGLGRASDATREAKAATALQPVSHDALDGPDHVINVGDVYALIGNADSAAAYYDKALSIPSWLSINTLRVDPLLASFRQTPAFKRLSDKWSRNRAVAQSPPARASAIVRRRQRVAAALPIREASTRANRGSR